MRLRRRIRLHLLKVNTMNTPARIITLTAILLITLASSVSGQDLMIKAPPQQHPTLLRNVTIHPISGPTINNGAILFDKGRITFVGPADKLDTRTLPDDLRILEFPGKHVYPGLIGANTLTGLIEIGAVRATLDYNEVGDITPEITAVLAVNPDSTIIPVTRSNGVLTVAVLPAGGLITGRASVIRMDGWTNEDLTIRADAGLVLNWPWMRPATGWWITTSHSEQLESINKRLRLLDETFDLAQAYIDARDADRKHAVDLRWEAMRAVLQRERPIFVRAQELEQIQSAVAWAARRNLQIVIVGGRDAHAAAELLLRHDVPVIISGTHQLPNRDDAPYDDPFTLPARLESAGVKWCLATAGGSFETPHERNLPYHAATAVAHGLPVDAAIRSITLAPAQILAVDDQLGSLEVGKLATLIITDGNPLEITTTIESAFIDGRPIDLANKQTVLAEKYREKYRQLGLIDEQRVPPTPAQLEHAPAP